MKASNLTQAYNKEKDLDIKVNKTFFVPPSKLFIEEGFNVRELDQDHIDSIAATYARGDYVPALVVKATANGFKVIDGHHRYMAALQAEVLRVECKDFKGSDADQIAFMITCSQGRNLAPMERALAYQRLVAQGWSDKEISENVGRYIVLLVLSVAAVRFSEIYYDAHVVVMALCLYFTAVGVSATAFIDWLFGEKR